MKAPKKSPVVLGLSDGYFFNGGNWEFPIEKYHGIVIWLLQFIRQLVVFERSYNYNYTCIVITCI